MSRSTGDEPAVILLPGSDDDILAFTGQIGADLTEPEEKVMRITVLQSVWTRILKFLGGNLCSRLRLATPGPNTRILFSNQTFIQMIQFFFLAQNNSGLQPPCNLPESALNGI